jgi:hypothetical protein
MTYLACQFFAIRYMIVTMPKRITSTYTDYDGREWNVTFTQDTHHDIIGVSVNPDDGKKMPLSTRLPLQRILDGERGPEMTLIPDGTTWQDAHGNTLTSHGELYLRDSSPRKRRTMDKAHYTEVAKVYKANRHYFNVTERVQAYFEKKDPPVSYTTAARWIKDCRTARGFNTLPPTTRGKKT